MRRIVVASLAMALLPWVAVPATAAGVIWQTGLVTHVADGDTFDIDIYGDGTSTPQRVRMIGINAMELGTCNADIATNRLEQMIDGEVISIGAIDLNFELRNRLGRHVKLDDGTNVGVVLAEEGLVLPFPMADETTYNDDYVAAADLAQADGIGIWDTNVCGNGPSQSTPLKMWAKWDADGDDNQNVNGEWIRIKNNGGSSLSLTGWEVRDSALNIYNFPSGSSIGANTYITVYVGSGTNTSTKKYWGNPDPIFDNTVGDGAYLVDSDGDIRAWFTYPCHQQCTDLLQGKLEITANYDASGDDSANPNGEWVNITNISNSTVDLYGYLLESWPYSYEFNNDSKIDPGERMRVYVGSGTSSNLTKYWGKPDGILDNGGDSVRVETFEGVEVAEYAYPCTPVCALPPSLRIDTVVYDAPGDDTANPNGEYIRIKNVGSGTVNFRDWSVYTWPYMITSTASRYLSPGETLTVYIGSGTNTSNVMYWGQPDGILDNGGDEVQLLTPHRDRADCHAYGSKSCAAASTASKLSITVNYDAAGDDTTNPNGEWISVKNISSGDVTLDNYQLESWGYGFTFDGNSTISPNETVKIYIGSGSTSRLTKHWGLSSGILSNGGDYVRIRNTSGSPLKESVW